MIKNSDFFFSLILPWRESKKAEKIQQVVQALKRDAEVGYFTREVVNERHIRASRTADPTIQG